MDQEDLNEVLSKHPSPEALIQFEQRHEEARQRGCACMNSLSGLDSECLYTNHTIMFRSAVSINLGVNHELL